MPWVSDVDELILNFVELEALACISGLNTLSDHLRLPELVFEPHLFQLKLADMPLKFVFVSLEAFFVNFELVKLRGRILGLGLCAQHLLIYIIRINSYLHQFIFKFHVLSLIGLQSGVDLLSFIISRDCRLLVSWMPRAAVHPSCS